MVLVKALPSKSGIDQEPEKIFQNPEQHDAGDHPRFHLQGPLRHEEQREVEKDGDEREYPGVVAGHRATAPENIEQPMLFNAPGRQVGRPAGFPFNMHFGLCEKIGQY